MDETEIGTLEIKKGAPFAGANDPKQAFIESLCETDRRLRREERGCLAERETIRFLKEKYVPNMCACVVSYTSTTGQRWFEKYSIVKCEDSSWSCSSGFRVKYEKAFFITDYEREMHGPQPYLKLSGGNEEGYLVLYGGLIDNGHNITRIRMIPSSGPTGEDEVHEGFVVFISQCTPPIEFEFYDASRTLVGKQVWKPYPWQPEDWPSS